jgi:hypothetical protein
MFNVYGTFNFGASTAGAGTPITQLIPPSPNASSAKTRLTKVVYTSGTTAHDLIFMRSANKVQVAADAAAAATTVTLDDASFMGTPIASGDYLVIEHSDGSFGLYKATGLASLTVTINALTKNVKEGARVWLLGAPSDTWHSTLATRASTRETDFADPIAGMAESGWSDGSSYDDDHDGRGEPLVVYSANGTVAGTLNFGNAMYTT